jgi:hypothetical protein
LPLPPGFCGAPAGPCPCRAPYFVALRATISVFSSAILVLSVEKTPAHSRDFSRELAGQLLINIFISYMTNPHKYINLTAYMERFRILCFPFGFLFL